MRWKSCEIVKIYFAIWREFLSNSIRFLGQPQYLGEFFGILESAGFRLNIHVDFQAQQPFVKSLIYNNKFFGWMASDFVSESQLWR